MLLLTPAGKSIDKVGGSLTSSYTGQSGMDGVGGQGKPALKAATKTGAITDGYITDANDPLCAGKHGIFTAARPSPIPSLCTHFTRAGIEWRR